MRMTASQDDPPNGPEAQGNYMVLDFGGHTYFPRSPMESMSG